MALLLTGCADDERPLGTVGFVEGFFGAVAADDPRAVVIGRDVLSAGGTAADAVTAMYFTAAVTLPSAASLGGGGVCLAFDPETGQVEAIDFLARAPVGQPSDASRPAAVPGNVRGFFALHAGFGRLRWEQLLAPAENIARFGTRVSRALTRDLALVDRALMAAPEVRAIFAVPVGGSSDTGANLRLVREGDALEQVELSTVIARVRTEGAGAFYSGSLPQQFAEAATAVGGGLTASDLRSFRPRRVNTVRVLYGDDTVHFAPPPLVGGEVGAAMWRNTVEDVGIGGPGIDRTARLADAAGLALRDRSRWTRTGESGATADSGLAAENPSAASFVAVDRDGGAVACVVTLNAVFGTGRIADGTGVVLAAAPGPGGRGAETLSPMLVVNEVVGEVYFAGSAAGGVPASVALTGVALRVLDGGEPLSSAVLAPRAISISPARAIGEPGDAIMTAFAGRNLRLALTPRLGYVAAIACPEGLPVKPESCAASADPRGNGLAAPFE